MTHRLQIILAVLFSGLLLMGSGCRTAERAVGKGSKLEAEGAFVEAFEAYAEAIEKDPTVEGGRSGLTSSGNKAVAWLLDEAEMLADRGEPYEAANRYLLIDEIDRRGRVLGINLVLPANYRSTRRSAFDTAIASALRSAGSASGSGDYDQAISLYEMAVHWELTGEQQRIVESERIYALSAWSDEIRAEGKAFEADRRWDQALQSYDNALERAQGSQVDTLDDDRIRVLLNWSEDDMRYNRYRGAHDRAAAALEIRPGLAAATRLLEEAIERGTVLLAPLPVWRTASAVADMPTEFLSMLNEELQYGYWDQPPLFIATPDPRDVRTELRRENMQNRVLSDAPVFRLGKRLNANLVLFGEVTRFVVTEEVDREETKTVKRRTGGNAEFVERRIRREITAVVSFTIVDPVRERVFDSGTVESRESIRYSVGIFSGDETELDLSRGQRELFSGEQKRDRSVELDSKLTTSLAKKLADRVYDRILRTVE